MRWLIRQLEQQSAGALKFSSGFRYAYLNRPPVNSDVLTTERVNETIELRAEGPWVRLLFHTHAWCGGVTIDANGTSQHVDLYSADHGFKEVVLTAGASGTLDVFITTGAKPNAEAKANQTWLASIEFAQPQTWTPKSRPVTPTCTLTHGTFGSFLTLTNDTIIGASIVREGCWAPKDVELFQSLIEPGMTVLDVGANIGHHTVVYGSLVGPEGHVVAVEPQSTIFRLLAANTVLNGGRNTQLIQACVGEEEGFVHLFPVSYEAATNFGALGVDPKPETRAAKGERCRVAQLDVLLAELATPLERVDFIKIDVQSFELFVLRGARETLARFKPTLFLEIAPYWMSKSYDYRLIYEFLWELGYEIEHLSDSTVPPGAIKEWSGRHGEEWDILARHAQRADLKK